MDVLNRLMCADLVPTRRHDPGAAFDRAGTNSNRQRVEAHTGSGSCAGCHATLINPIGFAFENFDAMGQLRTMDNGNPVDTTGQVELSDGFCTRSAESPELVALLADAPNVHGCYTKHPAEYTLARDMAGGDRMLVDAIEGISMNNNAGTKAMVLAIISQPSFLTRTGGALAIPKRARVNRRAFLRAAGTAGVGLPLHSKRACLSAPAFAQSETPVFGFFICTSCGVVQQSRVRRSAATKSPRAGPGTDRSAAV